MESSSMIQPEEQARNWLELPAEIMSMILLKLGAIEILTSAQNVCSSWRKMCKDPLTWRVIDLRNSSDLIDMDYDLEIMCRRAVDRSCGQLIDINIEYFGTDELLQYIAQSSNQLRRLRIVDDSPDITVDGLTEAISKLPLLEHLEIFICSFDMGNLRIVGRSCRLLKSLKLKTFWRGRRMVSDEEALAIAETMPNLRHLQILGNALSNDGLQAILDGCPDLESLDLRQCFNLNLTGQLGRKCAENIKILHLPHDPTDGYEFSTKRINFYDYDHSEDEYVADVDALTDDDDDFLHYYNFTRWY